MKKIIWIVGVLLVVVVAAVLVGPGLIDWNQYKGDLQTQASKAAGRALVINGDIEITVLPAPALIARDVSVANIEGGASETMARLELIEVRIAMAPLLALRIEVERVKLVKPVIQLEVLADGRRNWDFGPAPGAAAGTPAGAAPGGAPASASSAPPVRLDSFTIENGTLTYRDARKGTFERVDAINANIAAASLSGPYESVGSLSLGGLPIAYDVNVGEIIHGRTVPFNLKVGVQSADATVQVSGTVVGLADQPAVKGKVKGAGKSLAELVQWVAPAASLPGPLGQEFGFEGMLAASAAGAEVKGLSFNLGGTQATGDVAVETGKTLSVAARIAANRIDLDKWLALPAVPAKPPAPAKDAAKDAAEGAKPALPAPAAAEKTAAFTLPAGVGGSLIFSAGAITYRNGVIRDAVLNAELGNGEVTISQLSGQFPGSSDLALFGVVATRDGKPRFEGEMESTVSDLRGVMRWLGQEPQGVPADRLRKMTLVTKITANASQAQLTNIDMKLDSSRLTGGVTVAFTKRPSFGADVVLDRLNVDAYLPPETAAKADAGAKGTPAGAGAKAGGEGAAAKKDADPFKGLAVLNTFDANVKARLRTVVFRGERIKDALFDGTLYDGALDLRQFSVADAAGAQISASGGLAKLDAVPEASAFKFKVRAADVSKLMRLGGMEAKGAAKTLGTVTLDGRVDGSLMAPTIDVTMDGAGTKARLRGQIDGLALVPAVKNLTVQANTADAGRLLAVAGIDAPPAVRGLGRVSVNGRLDGNLLAPKVALKVNAAGGDFSLDGALNTLPIGAMADLDVAARHPDLSQLLGLLGAGYRPAGKTGALDARAHVKGGPDGITVTGLDAKVGTADVRGDIAVGLKGARPHIKATLNAGRLIVDPFLPAKRTASLDRNQDTGAQIIPAAWPGAPAPPAAGNRLRHLAATGRWPTEPLDLSALTTVDADVALKAGLLQFQGYRLDNADIQAALKDGRLDVSRLTGVLFGGALNGTLAAAAGARPQVAARFQLENMDVKGASRALTGDAVATGRLNMNADLKTTGASMAAMVGALSGEGALSMKGVDVAGASTGGILAGVVGLVSAFGGLATGLGGGKADSGADIAGAFTIARGVARSDRMEVRAGVGDGVAAGLVDLPRWRIDVHGEVKLAPNLLTALLSRRTKSDVTQAVPFTVQGRLDAPTVNLDTSKLAGAGLPIPGVGKIIEKAPKGVGTILQGILGGGAPQPQQPQPQPQPQQPQQPAPAETQQQQKITPEDILRQIFRR